MALLSSPPTICWQISIGRPELYTNTPRWALDWKYRRDRLKHQIDGRGSDLFCLQEVEKGEYDKYWLKAMQEKGYDGLLR